MDTTTLKANLQQKLEEVRTRKSEEKTVKELGCHHTKQKFKQQIIPDNMDFNGQAYFVYLACVECKEKRLIDYVVRN